MRRVQNQLQRHPARDQWNWPGVVLACVITVVLCEVSFAQVPAYATVQAGAYMQSPNRAVSAGWVGFESPLIRVPDRGFAAVTRFGFYYVDLRDDVQGLSVFVASKKNFEIYSGESLYALLGGGLIYEVREGKDWKDAALKFELGWYARSSLSVGIGFDYVPYPTATDKWFVYGALSLAPRLGKP
jgi:hypothetical protein